MTNFFEILSQDWYTNLDGESLPEVMLGAGGPGQEGAHVLRHLHSTQHKD